MKTLYAFVIGLVVLLLFGKPLFGSAYPMLVNVIALVCGGGMSYVILRRREASDSMAVAFVGAMLLLGIWVAVSVWLLRVHVIGTEGRQPRGDDRPRTVFVGYAVTSMIALSGAVASMKDIRSQWRDRKSRRRRS